MSCFTLEATDGAARAGVIRTAHGEIRTPAFMPVGTKGTVKTLLPAEVRALGADVILGNTYHLHLRPGEDVIEELGGLHAFTGWDGPILTDSGGFQVFSLRDTLSEVDDEGVTFRSVYDGAPERLTPEAAAEIQARLGSDIAMCLDICPPADASRHEHEEAVRRTQLWAERQVEAPRADGQLRFAIAQGGVDPDLRGRSIAGIVELPFDGYALGGLAVGESRGRDARRGRLGGSGAARRTAALLHGAGRRRGDPRGGRARDGHVRLRPPDADRPDRVGAHRARPAQPAQRAVRP